MPTKRDGSPRKSYVKDVPRSNDERVLAMIKLRVLGMTAWEIAKKSGIGQSTIWNTTERVLGADLAESGEDPRKVREAYWRPAGAGCGRNGEGDG